MPQKFIKLLFSLLFASASNSSAFAQFEGFEEAVPQNFKCSKMKEFFRLLDEGG